MTLSRRTSANRSRMTCHHFHRRMDSAVKSMNYHGTGIANQRASTLVSFNVLAVAASQQVAMVIGALPLSTKEFCIVFISGAVLESDPREYLAFNVMEEFLAGHWQGLDVGRARS